MFTTKPKRKIALQVRSGTSDFSSIKSYVNTGRKITVEKRFSYTNDSFVSMAHAERLAGENGRFMWIEEEVFSPTLKYYVFIFNVEVFEFEQA